MRLGPRAKLGLIMAVFLVPIVLSLAAYRFFRPEPTANYGELLLPPAPVPAYRFERLAQGAFGFEELRGRWILIASDSGACAAACLDKLTTLRQVRLAMGRNASRVERVFVVDDLRVPGAPLLQPYPGMVVALTPPGTHPPPGASNDRAHIYLADPLGNVMMRWPAAPDPRGMIKDLERLLKASQIG